MGRISGEFSPPRELVAMGASRMAGGGTVDVSGGGLAFEGTIVGANLPVPIWASIAVMVVGATLSSLVPSVQQVAMPATVVVVCVLLWFRYRAESGRTGVFRVPWSEVEHVVRLASAPDVLAFVFSRPIDGARTPEQVFFTPTAGLQALVDALHADAPRTLTIDVDSALLPAPEGTVDAE